MKFPIKKRSIVVAGRKTSITFEDEFWESLKEIAKERNETLKDLVNKINADRRSPNLSSAIRVFVLDYYRNRQNEMAASPTLDPNSTSPGEGST
jgi:predicted DNA-binding ribbon-helix-helix protein